MSEEAGEKILREKKDEKKDAPCLRDFVDLLRFLPAWQAERKPEKPIGGIPSGTDLSTRQGRMHSGMLSISRKPSLTGRLGLVCDQKMAEMAGRCDMPGRFHPLRDPGAMPCSRRWRIPLPPDDWCRCTPHVVRGGTSHPAMWQGGQRASRVIMNMIG